MTTQTLYIKYKTGEVTPSKFLYEIRKKQYPFLHPTNSLEDVIKILKGQNMISEVKDKNPELPEVECKTIDMVSPYEYAKGMNFELKLETTSAGQNTPTVSEISKAQNKVLKNLTKDPYYYSRKLMTDEEKKYEKGNEREYELKKQFIHNNKKGIIRENSEHDVNMSQDQHTFNQATKGIIADIIASKGFTDQDLAEPTTWEEIEDEMWYRAQMNEEIASDEINSIEEGCDCNDMNEELSDNESKTSYRELLTTLVEEWGLTEYDLQDEDVIEELTSEINSRLRMNEQDEEKPTIEVDDEQDAKNLVKQGISVKLNKKF